MNQLPQIGALAPPMLVLRRVLASDHRRRRRQIGILQPLGQLRVELGQGPDAQTGIPILGAVGGVNYLGRRIDSSELLPELTCCLT